MKMKKVLPIILAVLSVVLVATLILTTMFSKQDDSVICKGVSINGMDVSGMTPEEATAVVEASVAELQNRELMIQIDDQTVITTLADLGCSYNVATAVENAFGIGKEGNFLNRYREQSALEAEGVDVIIEMLLDEEGLRKFIETECTKFDVEAVNADLSRENGVFVVADHTNGRKVSIDETVNLVKAYMESEAMSADNSLLIEAVVADVEPEYTAEDVALCKDVLGKFSTSYATSSTSRAANVANGTRLINGSIIWPGETFSAGGTMNPITAENGYYMAGAYSNGQVIDSIGGGVCQVSTTLYNAVLFSELEIVERSPHSMTVGYVQPSMDAAIAGTYKDFKFKNNTDAPIYIEGVTAGRVVTFTIYGHETRPANRTIKFASEVLQVINPGAEKITEDPTQPTTYRKVTQSAHVGYKAQLWKIVYENGSEVSREIVNTSSYAAEPAYVTVGTKAVEEENTATVDNDTDKDTDKNTDKDKDKDKETVTKPEKEENTSGSEGTGETTGTENTTPDAGAEDGAEVTPEDGAVG